MGGRFDPETIDLAELRRRLASRCGEFVEGEVVGRSVLRDETASYLGCSALQAEQLVDTMIGRGFVRREQLADGRSGWRVTGA
ncbi:MAG: hypothetical protein IPM79_27835 [Polyangiaceae bacterium]|nr:hypothetical protein [Polyangiaceae bacterium]MBK8941315.1 hypothetical protein [Polyangiaceae bacterium]